MRFEPDYARPKLCCPDSMSDICQALGCRNAACPLASSLDGQRESKPSDPRALWYSFTAEIAFHTRVWARARRDYRGLRLGQPCSRNFECRVVVEGRECQIGQVPLLDGPGSCGLATSLLKEIT
jgi:hypothetical protein